ncbi:MAG TPA: hypothetical protein DEV93_05635 [Chloroflexi bacterium]|nr:hypothetical protein [Chloroflexota bacterium]
MINDKRPLGGGRPSSRSLRSYTDADTSCHLKIKHSLYKRSAYYRLLIRARLAADLWRSGHIDVDFVCGKNCCDLEETEEELVHQIWLDLPVGAPSLMREVTA